MIELEDIRGRTFTWLRRREKSLDARIYEEAAVVGTVARWSKDVVQAEFAGVWWMIRSVRRGLRRIEDIGFTDGTIVVAKGSFLAGARGTLYTLTIDGIDVYFLTSGYSNHAQWVGPDGHKRLGLRQVGRLGSGGEIFVPPTIDPSHAPILVLVAIVRACREELFLV